MPTFDIKNKTVGVFFGGKSPEHDVSIITGLLVLEELDKLGVKTEPIYVATDGAWCLGDELRDRKFLENVHAQDLYSLQRWSVDTRQRVPRLIVTRRPSFFSRRIRKDIHIVFPAFHGSYGEDGSFQGLCEVLGVPYVGSGVEGSAIAMNKVLTKQFFKSLGIKTTEGVGFSAVDWKTGAQMIKKDIQTRLTYPVFVKPAHAGSSIGISKIKSDEDLDAAVELAVSFDSVCLVENGVSPIRDLTCCVRECERSLQVSLVQDSSFGDSDFFTYQEKYLKSRGAQFGSSEKQLVIPANIPVNVTSEVQKISLEVFKKLGLSGIARVDFLYNPETSDLYANEVNPMPGTLYHHLWKKTGVEIGELVTDLLYSALRKHSESITKNRYFPSSILSGIKGAKFAK